MRHSSFFGALRDSANILLVCHPSLLNEVFWQDLTSADLLGSENAGEE